MRGWWLGGLLVCAAAGAAAETAATPWDDIKRWHAESVERPWKERLEREAAARQPGVYTIEESACRLSVGRRAAQGRLLIRGAWLAGAPEPIRLLDADAVVADVAATENGVLLPAHAGAPGVWLLPGGCGPFRVELEMRLPAREDAVSRWVGADWPAAVRAVVDLQLEDGLRLVEPPGYADEPAGRYRLPGQGPLRIRFAEAVGLGQPAWVEAEILTRLSWAEEQVRLSVWLLPLRVDAGAVALQMPAEARLTGSSLPDSQMRGLSNGLWRVECAERGADPIRLDFAVAADAAAGGLRLPFIPGNRGAEGYFTVTEPQDADVEVEATGLTAGIPESKLAPALRRAAAPLRSLSCAARGQPLRLRRLAYAPPPRTAPTVEAIEFRVTFEENGAQLIEWFADLPPSAGPRPRVRGAAGMEVWSLKVNGETRGAATDAEGRWVVPLAEGVTSRVELAVLRQGEKMGLQGRLEVPLPETGLLARAARVSVSLPARVELLAVEGAVQPEPAGEGAAAPAGRRQYRFAQPFYQGAALPLAVLYKEPAGERGAPAQP